MTQLDITFSAAPTTSGPRPRAARDPDPQAPKIRRDYAAEWAAFVEAHPTIAAHALRWAQAEAQTGRRVSAKLIAEEMRRLYGCEWNNSMTSWFAAWLVERDPPLASKIERRGKPVAK